MPLAAERRCSQGRCGQVSTLCWSGWLAGFGVLHCSWLHMCKDRLTMMRALSKCREQQEMHALQVLTRTCCVHCRAILKISRWFKVSASDALAVCCAVATETLGGPPLFGPERLLRCVGDAADTAQSTSWLRRWWHTQPVSSVVAPGAPHSWHMSCTALHIIGSGSRRPSHASDRSMHACMALVQAPAVIPHSEKPNPEPALTLQDLHV